MRGRQAFGAATAALSKTHALIFDSQVVTETFPAVWAPPCARSTQIKN